MELKHASTGKRILEGLIDIIILTAFFIFYVMKFGHQTHNGGYHVTGWSALLLFLIMFLYFIVLEKLWGRTIGKFIVRVKVVDEKGDKISWGQSIARNLVRILDMLFLGLVGLITILATDNNQRVGDLLAKTYVVNG